MLNNVCLQGNLGATPELRTAESGITSTSFRIAVKRNYKDADGTYKSDWFSCVAFRHTAEFICSHFGKGDMIIISGSLRENEYTDKSGNKGTKTEIFVENANFCGAKTSTAAASGAKEESAAPPSSTSSTDDDYPF